MKDNERALHAGCVGAPVETDAGCGRSAGEEGQRADPPPTAAGDVAGCEAQATAGADGKQATTPPNTLREFERALRGLGFTRLQAASIARRGFSGASAPEPVTPEPDDSERLRQSLERLARTLKGSR